jgi:hypothetical protein
MDVIGELRATLAGVHALATDDTKATPDKEFAATLKQVQELTPIIERERSMPSCWPAHGRVGRC